MEETLITSTNKTTPVSLAAKIAGLPQLDNAQLHQLWRDLYHKEPPKLSRLLLIQKLAWRIQEVMLGGLDDQAKEQLRKDLLTLNRRGRVAKPLVEQPCAGVVFERVWNGKTYRVKSLDRGFEYQGEWYRSLTAIASKITGSHTSGPRFFGLREKRNVSQSK